MANTFTGSNHQSIKHQNRALVFKILCTLGPLSRIDLSRRTGLSKMAITNIINALLQKQIIIETGETSESLEVGGSGRKPVLLDVNRNSAYALGIYISRDFISFTLCNFKGEFQELHRIPLEFEETPDTFLGKITFELDRLIQNHRVPFNKIVGFGISSIGPLDVQQGIILEPPNFHNLHQIPIKEVLKKKYGVKVFIDNDMNTSALAEKLYGKAVGIRNFIYFGVTNGIGAGIIADNVLYAGNKGFGGEIGHTTIHFEGPKCGCGNIGCLELYASIPAIVSQACNAVELGMETQLKQVERITWEHIVTCAKSSDTFCLKLLDRLSLYISFGIVNAINLFDPEVIYLGHDIALAGSLITERLEPLVNQRMFSSRYKTVPVEIPKFVDQSPLAGAGMLVFQKLFNGEIADSFIFEE